MPKKKMKDVTFKEFKIWANRRACDGKWSRKTAMTAIVCITEINRHISKEKYWNEIKGNFFNLEAEIEVEE